MLRIILCLTLAWIASEGEARAEVDYSAYDTALYRQIENRIKAKIWERIGEAPNARDRYFIIPFAYQNRSNAPEFSHSFLSVIRVVADNKQARRVPGFRRGTFRNREFEAFTISWLPSDFVSNPNLIVFRGIGARMFPKANTAPISPGKNFTLEETITLGAEARNAIVMWGPYEIDRKAFELGVKRKQLLDGGSIRYRADDRLYRKDRTAINCFHAIAGLDELYPNGGLFGTGFKMWGINGTARVLIEYTQKPSNKGRLLEPVDIKKDRVAFVYAPERHARHVYNPLENAFAYHE